MTNKPTHPVEPWQLTAYALNELETADALNVERAIEADPSLRTELEHIQRTLTSVRSALANLPTNVRLDEKQSEAIANQIEQSVAPNAIAAAASTLKIAERPFYLRKRFAALLATAAAIPLVATMGPMWLDVNKPIAYTVSDDLKNAGTIDTRGETGDESRISISGPVSTPLASSLSKELSDSESVVGKTSGNRVAIEASPDAVSAGSGLIGDVDTSFVPDMGLVIIKGNQRDVEKVQRVLDGVKEEIANQPFERTANSSDTDQLRSVIESPAESLVNQYDDSKPFGRYDETGEMSKQAQRDKQARGKQAGEKQASNKLGEASASVGSSGANSPSIGDYGGASGGMAIGQGGEGGLSNHYTAGTDGYVVVESKVTTTGDKPERVASDSWSQLSGGRPVAPVPPPQLSVAAGSTLAHNESEILRKRSTRTLEHLSELRGLYPIARDNLGTDRFEKIVETPFVETQKTPLSTFSIDVDTASYSKVRQTLIEGNRLPSPNMVRIEEMVNYFEYEYAGPQDGRPFASHMNVDRCPWNSEHQLVRVGLQAKKIDTQSRVKANIVFLLDVSGSMNEPNKLPLVKRSLAMLVNQLTENDRVAIVVYAGAAGCVLPSTCGIEKQKILFALDHLEAGGSTNGGQGIQLAYSIAKEHFIPGGANRVVLCTDGDFNVGVTGDDALVAMMQENAKSNIFLTCLGFGAGNYNDTMMEKISNKGNGVYGMIDNELEGRRMMVEQLGGTLVTVAKDVKIQVDFNSAKIAGYRLIGYEDRRLANRDFSDDKKDAGEIGAGHRVTALYEVIPSGKWVGATNPSEGEVSKYAKKPEPKIETPPVGENLSELLTLRVRYKEPEGSESTLQEFVLKETDGNDRQQVDRDMRWATAVAEFGLLLRRSEMAPNANWSDMLERATNAAGGDPYRLECLTMMRKAMGMMR